MGYFGTGDVITFLYKFDLSKLMKITLKLKKWR